MDIDVFTLFPEWFDWFGTQRPVRNAIERGTTLTCVNPRDFTTLSGRQVDDTPFGGGAGMVLRVDVMEQALAGHYGVEDAMQVREQRRAGARDVERSVQAVGSADDADRQKVTRRCQRGRDGSRGPQRPSRRCAARSPCGRRGR